MASNNNVSMHVVFALLPAVLMACLPCGQSIGVCYGMLGNNLPPPTDAVAMYKANNFNRMRLYCPSPATFNALRSSNIEVLLDVAKDTLQIIATNKDAANGWVRDTILAYWPDVKFRYIAVGNELIPRDSNAQYILPAMRNIYDALSAAGLKDQIKVSTAVDTSVLGNSFPPSAGSFSGPALNYLQPIIQFLASTGAPLLTNVYPYFSYIGNKGSISLAYATFTAPGTVVTDGQFQYQNLFDAMTDAVYAALEKVGGQNVPVMVSESGWPSDRGDSATINSARTYNSNLIKHVGKGTPRRSGREIETYIFAMFNENQKQPQGIENNFGLFYPNKQPVYPLN